MAPAPERIKGAQNAVNELKQADKVFNTKVDEWMAINTKAEAQAEEIKGIEDGKEKDIAKGYLQALYQEQERAEKEMDDAVDNATAKTIERNRWYDIVEKAGGNWDKWINER